MADSEEAQIGKWWILVALVAALVFSNSLYNEFVYDADFLVTSNQTFKDADQEGLVALGAVFKEGFWEGVNRTLDPARQLRGQALYRPLMMFTLGSLYVTVGEDWSLPYNLVNLAFHVIASLLVMRLAWLLARNRSVALIAGLLFAAHPLHSEAVAYLAGIGETQSVMLALLSMVLYWGAASRDTFSMARVGLAALAFAGAIFTKESAAVVLVLLPLLDLARGREAPPVPRRLLAYGLFLACVILNLGVRAMVLDDFTPDPTGISRLDNPVVREGFMVRLATGVTLYAKAIQLFVFPVGQSADYSFNQLPIARSLAEPASWSAFLICAMMTVCGFLWLRRWPAAGFGLLLFLFAFGPVSNIPVGIGTIFGERLCYMPSVGLALAVAAGVAALLAWCHRRSEALARVTRAVMIFVLVILSVATLMRNRVYASNATLYKDMVETAPESARAHYQHGELQRRKHYEGSGGDLLRAVNDFRDAVKIMPDFHLGWVQLGIAYGENGEYQRAIDTLSMIKGAVPQTEGTLAFRNMVDRHLAQIYSRLAGSSNDPAEVMESIGQLITMLEELHQANPDDPAVISELSNLYVQVNRLTEARTLLEPAVNSFPDSPTLKAQIVQVYAKSNELDRTRELVEELVEVENQEARKVGLLYAGVLAHADGKAARADVESTAADGLFQQALAHLDEYINLALSDDGVIHPQEADGYFFRGQVQFDGFRDFEAALADYQRTVQVNPNHGDVYARIAECLVALKRFDAQSTAFFAEIEKIYPDNPYLMIGHARVLIGRERFAEAEALLERVIELGMNGVNPHSLLAKAMIDDDRPAEALERLERARSEHGLPAHPEIENLKGVALFEMERYDDAILEFSKAAEIARQNTAEFGGRVPHLMFQRFKTMLRVKGEEAAGLQGLSNLDQMLKNARAQARREEDRRALNQLRPYILYQQSWGLGNVDALRDDARSLSLLERAVKIAEDDDFSEMLITDLYPPLIEAYEARGDVDQADDVRARLDERQKKLDAR